MYFNGKQIFQGAFIRDWESMSLRDIKSIVEYIDLLVVL
jgi:hypothetical protein